MVETKEDKKRKYLQLKLVFFRYYKLITFILIIIILFLSYYFILEPKYRQVSVGGVYDLATLEKEISKRENYLSDLKTLATNYHKVSQKDVEKLKDILPEKKDIAGLFAQLETLALKHNFLLAGVTINEIPEAKVTDKSAEKIKKLNISLNLIGSKEGGYEEIKKFLSALEYNLRLFDVNAVYFKPDSSAYTINIFTYYYQKD